MLEVISSYALKLCTIFNINLFVLEVWNELHKSIFFLNGMEANFKIFCRYIPIFYVHCYGVCNIYKSRKRELLIPMARPRSDAVDYFYMKTHDSTTLKMVKCKYGAEGNSFFTELYKMLGREERHCIDVRNPVNLDRLCLDAYVNMNTAISILNDLAAWGKINPAMWSDGLIYYPGYSSQLADIYRNRRREIPGLHDVCNYYGVLHRKTFYEKKEGSFTDENPTTEGFYTVKPSSEIVLHRKTKNDGNGVLRMKTPPQNGFTDENPSTEGFYGVKHGFLHGFTDINPPSRVEQSIVEKSNPSPIDKESSSPKPPHKGAAAVLKNNFFRIAAFSADEIDDVIDEVVTIKCLKKKNGTVENPIGLRKHLKKEFSKNPDVEWSEWIELLMKERVYTEGMRRIFPEIDVSEGEIAGRAAIKNGRELQSQIEEKSRLKRLHERMTRKQKMHFETLAIKNVVTQMQNETPNFDQLMEESPALATLRFENERYRLIAEAELKGVEFELNEGEENQ